MLIVSIVIVNFVVKSNVFNTIFRVKFSRKEAGGGGGGGGSLGGGLWGSLRGLWGPWGGLWGL